MTTRDSFAVRIAPAAAWQRAIVAAGVLLLGAIAAGPAFPAEPAATTHTVVMKATSYAPQALTIKRGDTVVWVNEDPFPHTVTAPGPSTRRASLPAPRGSTSRAMPANMPIRAPFI